MKLTMDQLTEKDKRLLVFLACFIVIVVFVFLLILPIRNSSQEKEQKLKEAKQLQTENEYKDQNFETMAAMEKTSIKDLENSTKDIYPLMTTDEIDDIVTNLALDMHLDAKNLNISIPEEGVNISPYIYSENAKMQDTADETSEENAQVSTSSNAGVTKADVTMTVYGDETNMKALIDVLMKDYPSIRVTGYQFGTSNNVAQSGDAIVSTAMYSMTISMEVYMCDKGESK